MGIERFWDDEPVIPVHHPKIAYCRNRRVSGAMHHSLFYYGYYIKFEIELIQPQRPHPRGGTTSSTHGFPTPPGWKPQ